MSELHIESLCFGVGLKNGFELFSTVHEAHNLSVALQSNLGFMVMLVSMK